MSSMILVVLVIFIALVFDFINGFHDTANAIATSVSTRAIKPQTGIVIAASFNFAGALSGTAVASTIGKNIIPPDIVNPLILLAALSGAIFWMIFTWYFGIPSSSSHALIGGLTGAVIAGFGPGCVNWQGLVIIVAGLILSPLISFIIGYIVMIILFMLFRRSSPIVINDCFRRLQALAACMASFAHGSNDAQKSMGIITMVLVCSGLLCTFQVPLWVKIFCAIAIAAGTAVGGWRIIRTIGQKIFRIEPINGFAADLASSLVIYSASILGFPVSTTQTMASSILGVGAAKRISGIRWIMAGRILTAWLITIPLVASISAVFYNIIQLFT